ncbi:hypothetical protein BJ508DRAFT_333784 [Ascobolus immersus RN42]|uniref:Uncharacterized protein n=1 Tax=Ascobolus immersus RN42 TaxID=1160509 RepID=A0A3N4HVQ8_ASCIM|nr:hypothetical protein BJ508DRAFT_333784 [Ascobolus immersus RN42]
MVKPTPIQTDTPIRRPTYGYEPAGYKLQRWEPRWNEGAGTKVGENLPSPSPIAGSKEHAISTTYTKAEEEFADEVLARIFTVLDAKGFEIARKKPETQPGQNAQADKAQAEKPTSKASTKPTHWQPTHEGKPQAENPTSKARTERWMEILKHSTMKKIVDRMTAAQVDPAAADCDTVERTCEDIVCYYKMGANLLRDVEEHETE